MKTFDVFTGVLAAAMLVLPAAAADQSRKPRRTVEDADMQRAIQFQRDEDRAAARQAQIEARHPTVNYNEANREQQETMPGRKVADPGPKPKK